jgi:hypothetical protein
MSASSTARWLSEAVSRATRSARFCVTGCLPVSDPGLEVGGLGFVRVPLKRGMAKQLIGHCEVAPYGKGTQTLVDTKVRKTFELDPKQFHLSPGWGAAVDGAARHAAEQLGLPADQVEVRLYKLLVYEKGGFFLAHRDSEKHEGMVASLIVVLPNAFEGGALVVRHGEMTQSLGFQQAARGTAACYAAFYADCEHEVQRVTGGVRLCLAYNLVLKPSGEKPASGGKRDGGANVLAGSIRSWVATHPETPLVFALEHHYTEHGLSLDLLKGADRQIAELVVPAAEATDCLVHLAQVSRHLQQYADDGSFGRGHRWGYRQRGEIEIGETYEDELNGVQWTNLQGEKQPWGEIALELPAIVSSMPIDDWQPTSEDYEGYTGNAGNTLDRWYHRSAIVLWRRDHHFSVVASCGPAVSVPLFRSMVGKLAKTPKKRLDEARTDCVRFARGIIARWLSPRYGYGLRASQDPSPLDDFPDLLLKLCDRDAAAVFLSKMAEADQTVPLGAFVVAACGEFGWAAFAQELRQLIGSPSDEPRRQEIPLRDVEWLAAFCLDKTADPEKSRLAQELCALAVERFCVPRQPEPGYYGRGGRREPSVSESSLPLLLKALAASGCGEELARVTRFVESSPALFSLEDGQVPALQSVLPWSQEEFGSVPPPLLSWLASARKKLESATANKPTPPADWGRPADVACACQYCTQLNAFLRDPANEVGRIAAPEAMRRHLIVKIDQHGCDVRHALERKGSPYRLVLTKTTGSFDRATTRFEADCRLLKILDKVGEGLALRESSPSVEKPNAGGVRRKRR